MRFLERKEFTYDAEMFGQADTQTALKFYDEYVRKHSGKPPPKVMEVDRRSEKFDPLWHVPLDERVVFSRVFEIPMIVQAEKLTMRLSNIGIVPQQMVKFHIANLMLAEIDWFPMRGDYIYWSGYRHIIVNVVIEPNAFWGQTNVWTGLVCETRIPAEGDARPILDPGTPVPRELIQTRPVPEV